MTGADNDNQEILKIRPIGPDDKFTGLSLGHADFVGLKTFAKSHAMPFERNFLSRTYVASIDETPKAYITILAGQIQTGDQINAAIDDDVDYPYDHYPVMKIARLAVDRRLQKRGIGEQLIKLVLGIADTRICPHLGCRFAMVDAKKQSVDFYTKCGFTLLNTEGNKNLDTPIMFIDLMKTKVAVA